MPFSNEEAFDMLAVFFECMQNANIAARIYAVRYPRRHRFNPKFFNNLAQRLRTTGNIHRPVYRRRGKGRSEENVINVLGYIEFNPHVSTRVLSTELGITKTTIVNILKEHR